MTLFEHYPYTEHQKSCSTTPMSVKLLMPYVPDKYRHLVSFFHVFFYTKYFAHMFAYHKNNFDSLMLNLNFVIT